MGKYRVLYPTVIWVTVDDIEAEDKEEAIELGVEDAEIEGFSGNGGLGKLIGTHKRNVTVDIGLTGPIDYKDTFELEPEVKEIVE